jgi:hypothetical protein
VLVGCRRIEPMLQTKYLGEDVIQPKPGRRAAKQIKILREQPPYFARVALAVIAWRTSLRANPEIFERHALAVEHPIDVVIRCDQQLCRIGKRFVVREPARIGMPMWANNR